MKVLPLWSEIVAQRKRKRKLNIGKGLMFLALAFIFFLTASLVIADKIIKDKTPPPILMEKRVYHQDDEIILNIGSYKPSNLAVKIIKTRGETEQEFQANYQIDKENNKLIIKPIGDLKPGSYTIKLWDGEELINQTDFSWGVLALNTNKSIYYPDEEAHIAIAVLDNEGQMVCDAEVNLKIIDPNLQTTWLTTDNGLIKVNPECFIHDVTLKPDYETRYKTNKKGVYSMELTAVTSNGSYTIEDQFQVKEFIPFDVERDSATRVYPFEPYPVTLNIKANQDFDGVIREQVPLKFEIEPPLYSTPYDYIKEKGGVKEIYWNVNIKKGEELQIGYYFDTPDISPFFYTTGPLQFVQYQPIIYNPSFSDEKEVQTPDLYVEQFNMDIVAESTESTESTQSSPTLKEERVEETSLSAIQPESIKNNYIVNEEIIVFEETRKWQLAIDADQTVDRYASSCSNWINSSNATGAPDLADTAGWASFTTSNSAYDEADNGNQLDCSGYSNTSLGTFVSARVCYSFATDGAGGGDDWVDLEYTIGGTPYDVQQVIQNQQHSNSTNSGYWCYSAANINSWTDVGNTTVSAEGNKYRGPDNKTALVDSAWIEVTYTPPTINIQGSCRDYTDTADCSDDGSNEIAVVVDGVLQAQVDTTVDGSWSVSGVDQPSNGAVIHVFINGESTASERANAVTIYDGSGDITGVSLYHRNLTIGSDDAGIDVSNSEIGQYDYTAASSDPDIIFEVDASNNLQLDNLTNYTDEKLTVLAGDTYTPGANIDTHDFEINGTLTPGSSTMNVEGTFDAKSGSTLTSSTSTLTFDSTSAVTEDLITAGTGNLYNLVVSDGGGGLTVQIEDPVVFDNDVTITGGTLDVVSGENNQITVGGSWDNDDTFLAQNGEVLFNAGSGTKTIDADGTGTDVFYDLTFNDSGGTATFQLTTTADVDRNLTITGGNFDANSNNINVGGNWDNDDTFTSGTQTTTFDAGSGTKTIDADGTGTDSFSTVVFNDGVGPATFQLTDPMDVNADLTITAGELDANGQQINVAGNWSNSDTFTSNSNKVVMDAADAGNTLGGTMTGSTGKFYEIEFDNSAGSWTFNANAETTNFTITNATDVTAPTTLTVSGNFTGGSTFTHNSGSVSLNATSGTQAVSGSTTFYDLSATTTTMRTIQFAQSSVTTIHQDGDLTLTGNACDALLLLRSSAQGSAYTITRNTGGIGSDSLSYLDIQDSTATNSLTASNSVDSGGNTSWSISANSCIGASTNSGSTAYSFQRKTFYAYNGGTNSRYWQFFHDGDEIDIKYSTDGSNWTHWSELAYNTSDFSVWNEYISSTEYVFLAVKDGSDIKVLAGTLGASSITWDNDIDTALTGGSGSYSYPYITVDSSDYLWVGAMYNEDTNYIYKATDSTAVGSTDFSTLDWNTPNQIIDDQTSSNVYGNIVSIGSGDMYATVVVDTSIEGCIWDDTEGRWEDSSDNACTQVGSADSIDITTGLVGYWKMNESSWNGTTDEVVDSSGKGYHGTGAGNATTTAEAFRRAGTFDGTGDYFDAGDEVDFDIEKNEPVTLSIWAKTTTDAGMSLFSKEDNNDSDKGYQIQFGGSDVFFMQIINTYSTNGIEVSSNETLNYSDGNWHHVVGTYDGSEDASGVKLYFDGRQLATTTSFNNLNATILNNVGLRVGSRTGSVPQDYTGEADEARIYNRVLSPAEVEYLYAQVPEAVNIDDASDFSAARRVVRTSSGTLYALARDFEDVEMWKSSDSGVSWAEQDSTNSPNVQTGNSGGVPKAAIDSADTIHVAWGETDLDFNTDVARYVTFSTSSDTWGAPEDIDASGEPSKAVEGIAVDSNDIPHVVGTLNAGGVEYSNRVGGGWDTTPVVVDSNGAGSISDLTINEDDIPEISYINSTDSDLAAAVGNQNDAGSFTLQDVDTSVNNTGGQRGTSIAVDQDGNTWVAYVDEDGTNDYVTLAKHNDADGWSIWTTDISNSDNNVGYEPSVAINGRDVYIFYRDDSTDQKVVYDMYDSDADTPSWEGETVLNTPLSGGDFISTGAKWAFLNNNYSPNRIDYLFSDGTDVFWDTLYLRRMPTNIDDASDFGSFIDNDAGRQLVRTSSGNLYSVLNDGGSCEVWKSIDEGNSWAIQDTGNQPLCTSGKPIKAAIDSTDTIHILYINTGTDDLVRWITFDTSNDQFAASFELVYDPGLASGYTTSYTSIKIDSNDKPHAVFNSGGTILKYSNRVSGSWKSAFNIESGRSIVGASLAISEDDIPEVSYVNTTDNDLSAAVGDQNDATSFGTPYDVDTSINGVAGQGVTSIAVDSSGNTWVAYVDENGTDDYIALAYHPDGSGWTADWELYTESNIGTEPSLVVDGTNIYVVYEDNQDDIVYDLYSNTTWFPIQADQGTAVNIDGASDFGTMAGAGGQIIRTSTGVLYALLNDSGSCEVWKSSDGGATWSEQDAADNPACVSGSAVAARIDGTDTIHIIYEDDVNDIIHYQTFNTATDQFGTEETVTSMDTPTHMDIAIDTNYVPHIVAHTIWSLDDALEYSNRVGGSWDSTPVVIESNSFGFPFPHPSIVINEDDIPEVSYINSLDDHLTVAEADANDPSAFTDIYDVDTDVNDISNERGTSIAVDEMGNTWVAYVDDDGGTDNVALAYHADADAWTSWTIDINNTNEGFEPSIAIIDNGIYVFYEDESTIIAYDRYNGAASGGSWDGELLLEMAVPYQDAKVRWAFLNNNFGSNTLDYLFSDGTDVLYNQLLVTQTSPTEILEQGAPLQDVKARWSYINNYDSTGTARVQTNTYYFDGSDAAASDPDNIWTNETNADDGDTSTEATTSDLGSETTNYIQIEGADAPSSGGTIAGVKARLHAGQSGSASWSSWFDVSAPSGGWTWSAVQGLEARIATAVDIGNGFEFYIYEDGTAGGAELVYSNIFGSWSTTAAVTRLEIMVESTNTDTQAEIDYLYVAADQGGVTTDDDVFYNRTPLGTTPGSQDAVGSVSSGLSNSISTLSDSSNNVHLAYIDGSGYTKYQQRTSSWQSAVTLDGTAGNEYPTISIDTAGSNGMYVFWIRGDDIYYRRACSDYTSWDSATTMDSTGTNDWITSSYEDGTSGKLFSIWTQGAASPYNIDWNTITPTTCAGGNNAPDAPTSLAQKKTDDTVLSTGDWTNETSVKFTASASDTDNPDTLYLCIEVDQIGTAFSNTEDSCGSGGAYSGSPITLTHTISSLSDDTQFHWQARVKDEAGDYSNWVSYGGNGEAERDFGTDTTAPTGGTVYDGTEAGVDKDLSTTSLSQLSANWDGFDASVSGLNRYDYSIGTTQGGTDVKGWTDNSTSTSVTASSLSLNTSTVYYFNVRAVDNAGNIQSAVSSDGQVVTPSLSFSVSPSSVTFNNLNSGNSYTDTETNTLTTSTNAYDGYVIRAFTTDILKAVTDASKTIGNFDGGTYASPDEWLSGDRGFGYNSSDTNVQGSNKFNSTPCPGGGNPPCYAPFSQTGPGDIVADHTSTVSGTPISNEQFTITYQVKTDAVQDALEYTTTVVYTITAQY